MLNRLNLTLYGGYEKQMKVLKEMATEDYSDWFEFDEWLKATRDVLKDLYNRVNHDGVKAEIKGKLKAIEDFAEHFFIDLE